VGNPQRELIFARSDGVCQCAGACGLHEGRCTTRITLETFHCSHLRSRAHGGVDHESNLEAWCSRCNLTLQSRDASDPRLAPREWQLRELDKVVGAIARTGAGTLSAAPGAGKTIFAGLAFESLREAGIVERMLVVVPRRGLVDQWVDALAVARQLELKPNSASERTGSGQVGCVVTYQSLPNRDMLEAHMERARLIPTLIVLDEVHHLARDVMGVHAAWGNAVAEFAGDVEVGDLRVAGILNLSGTLWRSDESERISTVRYTPPNENGKIVSLVDGEVTATELIQIGELRSIDLFRVDTEVRVADYKDLTYVEGNLADLDRDVSRAAVRALANINSWRTAFVSSVLDRLERAHRHLDHHVKALIVAASQEQAVAFRDEVDRQMRHRGLQPLAALAISDEPEAQRTLENFRAQRRVGVLCTVDMAGEGYDCPDIAVLGYASNKLTELYVRQVTARAMRVTDRERELGALLPAVVVLPDSPELVETFLRYLGTELHEVRLDQQDGDRRTDEGTGPRLQRFVLDDAVAGRETITVTFLDGTHENIDSEYMAALSKNLVAANMPELFWPRATAVMQRTLSDVSVRRPFEQETARQEPTHTPVSVEEQARMKQTQLKRLGGWWHVHGDIPVGHFNRLVNEAGGIRDGNRDYASLAQLDRALEFAQSYIDDYKRRRGMEA
jgi:superfamily II DNA or RNA helicase